MDGVMIDGVMIDGVMMGRVMIDGVMKDGVMMNEDDDLATRGWWGGGWGSWHR